MYKYTSELRADELGTELNNFAKFERASKIVLGTIFWAV
jgi:hypothetical protein